MSTPRREAILAAHGLVDLAARLVEDADCPDLVPARQPPRPFPHFGIDGPVLKIRGLGIFLCRPDGMTDGTFRAAYGEATRILWERIFDRE